jgi:hypothetical protein
LLRRIMVQSQPRQIVHETLSQKKPPQDWKCGSSLLCKHKVLSSNPSPTKRKEKALKKTPQKKKGLVVECLKIQALSSSPSTEKKKPTATPTLNSRGNLGVRKSSFAVIIIITES